ncbi:MAG: phosphotransferase [Nannocystales bacterium]
MVEARTGRTESGVRAALRSFVPELANAPLRPAGVGECYEAWWIGDGHIVRFASNDSERDASNPLAVEAALLPSLAEAIEVRIPRPTQLGCDPATGRSMLVHEAVLGSPLLAESWDALTPTQRRALAVDIGRFVRELQAVGIDTAPVRPPETRFHGLYSHVEAIERLVLSQMPRSAAESCRRLAQEVEPCPREAWVFVHGDLYDHHVLVADDARLAGVIDFGDLGVGDPACDLGTLMDDFGIEFVREALGDSPLAPQRLARARFYCVWEALAWAAEELAAGPVEGMADHLRRVGHLALAQLA